jgi:hypothetical protein
VIKSIRSINALAQIIETTQARANVDQILGIGSFSLDSVSHMLEQLDDEDHHAHELAYRSHAHEEHVHTGLVWEEIGKEKPVYVSNVELHNHALAQRLQHNLTLSDEEWHELGLSNLTYDNYIKVGDKYLKPERAHAHHHQDRDDHAHNHTREHAHLHEHSDEHEHVHEHNKHKRSKHLSGVSSCGMCVRECACVQ